MLWECWRARRPSALSQGSRGAGDAIAICGSPRLLSQDLLVPAPLGRRWLSLWAPPARGQPGHQAVPAVTGTFRDVAPGTELCVETFTYFHTGYQRIIRRRGLWVAACLGWLQIQPREGGSARHDS